MSPDAPRDVVLPQLTRQLTLQRGHWLEAGLLPAFTENHCSIIPQLEIETQYQGTPIKAHLDFTLACEQPYPTVRILELKSTKKLPKQLYLSYEMQMYGQVGLLKALWNQSAFTAQPLGTIGDNSLKLERQSFPAICKQLFGFDLPSDPNQVDIEAWVLCLSMSEAKAFGTYMPDQSMCQLCLQTAAQTWDTLQQVRAGTLDFQDVPTSKGFDPLCAYCDHNADCPKFAGQFLPEYSDILRQYARLKVERDALEADIQECENQLKTAYRSCQAAGKWLNAESHRFRVAKQAGRRILDKEKLRLELIDLTGSEYGANTLLCECENDGMGFERLYVQPINEAS